MPAVPAMPARLPKIVSDFRNTPPQIVDLDRQFGVATVVWVLLFAVWLAVC
jgi:hypothetical protein